MALPTSSNAKASAKTENSRVLTTEPLVWTPYILIKRKLGLSSLRKVMRRDGQSS